MVISILQTATVQDVNTTTSANTIQITMTGVQAGSLLYLLYSSDNNSSTPSTTVSDNINGSWPAAIGYAKLNGFQTLGHSYIANSGAGSVTATITFNASYTKKGAVFIEIKNAALVQPLAGHSENLMVAVGSGVNAITSGSFNSLHAPCLIIGGNYAATQNPSLAYSGSFTSLLSSVWNFGVAGSFACFGHQRLTSISSSALTTTVGSGDSLGVGTYYAVAAKFTENFSDGALLGTYGVGYTVG